MTFRERGSKAAGFCLDSIAVVTRRKFGANHLKAVSAVTESLRKQEANHVHSSGKNQAAVLTSVCQPARGEEQLHAGAATSSPPSRPLRPAKRSCLVAEQLPPKLTLLRQPANGKAHSTA